MARLLRIALLADGRGDRALLPVLTWLLARIVPDLELPAPGFRARVASAPLEVEITETVDLFRPDLIFVHRDAERVDPAVRRSEIPDRDRLVKVVPVRMTEAWLLFDESAIRTAAGRPSGRQRLDLPSCSRVEELADPKTCLRDALVTAAEVEGRRRKRFVQQLADSVARVADLIEDFSPLLVLPAFQALESDCRAALA